MSVLGDEMLLLLTKATGARLSLPIDPPAPDGFVVCDGVGAESGVRWLGWRELGDPTERPGRPQRP